jgi:hypothetical protein
MSYGFSYLFVKIAIYYHYEFDCLTLPTLDLYKFMPIFIYRNTSLKTPQTLPRVLLHHETLFEEVALNQYFVSLTF